MHTVVPALLMSTASLQDGCSGYAPKAGTHACTPCFLQPPRCLLNNQPQLHPLQSHHSSALFCPPTFGTCQEDECSSSTPQPCRSRIVPVSPPLLQTMEWYHMNCDVSFQLPQSRAAKSCINVVDDGSSQTCFLAKREKAFYLTLCRIIYPPDSSMYISSRMFEGTPFQTSAPSRGSTELRSARKRDQICGAVSKLHLSCSLHSS